jgi:two-component sensor histidine kinase/DNA-binding NarL/FixJ family response regulator
MLITKKIPSIMIVDDNIANLDLLSRILSKFNYHIITAIDGIDAIEKIVSFKPELILLDIMMPRLNGFETCQQLKQNPLTKDVPIIFMTALDNVEDKLKGFELGANDYVTKPFHKKELLARVRSHLNIFYLGSSLKTQNTLLQKEINEKYEAELKLLEVNEQWEIVNKDLIAEIENRKLIEIELQQEIVERRQITQELKKSLEEKELLLKEIHHRVKNNLFIISSLLEMQATYLNSPELSKIINNSQNRLMSMALIHEQLYGDKGLSTINFAQYLTALTDNLKNSYLSTAINFTVEIEDMYLNVETITPCGLIINELITNAVEHAFSADRFQGNQGNIFLSAKHNSDGEIALIVQDNGIGCTDLRIFYESESLGMNLITTLVEQLEGTLQVTSNYSSGTEITIVFRELDYQQRI